MRERETTRQPVVRKERKKNRRYLFMCLMDNIRLHQEISCRAHLTIESIYIFLNLHIDPFISKHVSSMMRSAGSGAERTFKSTCPVHILK